MALLHNLSITTTLTKTREDKRTSADILKMNFELIKGSSRGIFVSMFRNDENSNKTGSGFFVAIEGLDGSGKSTLAARIYKDLMTKGIPSFLTREPGNTEIGEKLRTILHSNTQRPFPKTEFLLFAADRSEHFSRIVLPALSKNNIVISDRSADSSLAYQGYGRGLDLEIIKTVNNWVMQGRNPDLIIYIDTPIEVAHQRLVQSRKVLTSFENEEKVFWQKVRDGFEEIFSERSNVIRVDGLQKSEKNSEIVLEHVLRQYSSN